MTATRADIRRWVEQAQAQGATHLIVAVDRFDHDNYPIYVMPGEDVGERLAPLVRGENMQGYDEVYSFTGRHSVEAQMAELRAVHLD